MMSFLDLSSTSEEERRLINEILADTSVVNFAEPSQQQVQHQHHSKQQQHQHQQQQQQQSCQHASSSKTTNRPQLKQQPQHMHQHQLNDLNQHHYHHHHNHHHHNSQPQQHHTQKIHRGHINLNNQAAINQANNTAPKSNYVQNNLESGLQDQRLQVPPIVPGNELHNTSPVLVAGNGPEINLNSNDIGTSNNLTNNLSYKSQSVYPITSQENSMGETTHTAADHVTAKTSTGHYQTSLPDTLTTNSVTQSTTNVPPHSTATQMPPPMAGDMNSVMGMDMNPTQPTGYAMPPMPQAHSYGPPPPPHHVYGGPPIFQPYTTHYIIPYNLQPYPMSFVMPPANTVVPSRHQVANQSSQPSNASANQRPLTHPTRHSKPKDFSKQHQQVQNQYHNHNHMQQGQDQQRQQASPVVDASPYASSGGSHKEHPHEADAQNRTAISTLNGSMKHEDILVLENPTEPLARSPQAQSPHDHSDVEATERTSDEDSPAQPPQSTELRTKELSEESKDLNEDSNILQTEESNTQPLEDSREHDKSKINQANDSKKTPSGPWGSASSKSWASLFKAGGSAHHGPPVNGEITHNTTMDSDNSDDEGTRDRSQGNVDSDTTMNDRVASTKEQRSQDAARRALDKMGPKLAQKINSISLKHSLPLLRPRGFINKGNGCYINSTLQALIACPPFYNLMKEIGDLRAIKRESSCTPILDSFAELFLNFPPLDANKKSKQQPAVADQKLQMNHLQADAIEPKCIYDVLGHIKSECLRGAQEDAEEFLSSVLNGLHEEMIGLGETLQYANENSSRLNGHLSDVEDANVDVNNDENLWREVGPKNRSLPIRAAKVINTPIQEIFGGSLFSIRTAGKDRCGHRSPFFDLQLDISSDNVKSLQDAIKSFTATEIIQDFYCSKTKQKLDAQRRTSLDQLPPILILHLKQFIYTQDHGLKKLMKRIEYPIDFEIPESCLHDKNSDKSLRNSRTYKLLAVVYHEGKEAVKGHYLTDVYHIGSSQWIRCDDSNLKVVPAPRIENPDSTRTPYLLFYRRLNTLGPRQINSHDNKKKS